MKKNLFILSFMCLCGLMFTACGEDKNPDTPDTPVTPEEPVVTNACYTLTVEYDLMGLAIPVSQVFWGTEEQAKLTLDMLKITFEEDGTEIISAYVEKNDQSESDCVNAEE